MAQLPPLRVGQTFRGHNWHSRFWSPPSLTALWIVTLPVSLRCSRSDAQASRATQPGCRAPASHRSACRPSPAALTIRGSIAASRRHARRSRRPDCRDRRARRARHQRGVGHRPAHRSDPRECLNGQTIERHANDRIKACDRECRSEVSRGVAHLASDVAVRIIRSIVSTTR